MTLLRVNCQDGIEQFFTPEGHCCENNWKESPIWDDYPKGEDSEEVVDMVIIWEKDVLEDRKRFFVGDVVLTAREIFSQSSEIYVNEVFEEWKDDHKVCQQFSLNNRVLEKDSLWRLSQTEIGSVAIINLDHMRDKDYQLHVLIDYLQIVARMIYHGDLRCVLEFVDDVRHLFDRGKNEILDDAANDSIRGRIVSKRERMIEMELHI